MNSFSNHRLPTYLIKASLSINGERKNRQLFVNIPLTFFNFQLSAATVMHWIPCHLLLLLIAVDSLAPAAADQIGMREKNPANFAHRTQKAKEGNYKNVCALCFCPPPAISPFMLEQKRAARR